MDHHAGQQQRPNHAVAIDSGMMIVTVAACVASLLLAFVVPVGLIVLLPVVIVIAHDLYRRRAWRRELRDLMSPQGASKKTRT